ncbi:T9SS type A sorting domain-containing protein [Flavitalea sp. BT771]|uniref:T9SS type A sorting domain-containing protein n=1 Tax=Flavitalea sp. BT771 TaxID=3063329 RepID=UPI0026E1F506|nr:T9SS type A sorting domain-containing protein [Flavitalea sp. BT771]MDO6432567.1 T9SS type A sorting domain-containing protein [Flavitalea sp. BT771]MDV6222157.1 T9SS type A sorting domain-containing protein [Flavitalea sp. BT771]
MRPLKTSVPLATFLLSLVTLSSSPLLSVAQCTGALQSTSYSTTFTGTGNAVYGVTWPQYAPPGGYSLVSAVLKSVVSITASYQITNNNGADATNVKPGVTGEDILQVNGNDLTDEDGNSISDVTFLKNLTAVPVIHAGETYNYPATVVYNNFKMMNDSIATNNGMLNDFVGTGDLNITYSNTPGYNINAAVQVTPSYSITNKVSLTYYYCYTGALASAILTFTATRQNDGTVALNWISAEAQSRRQYVVQVSEGNNTDFSDVNAQLSTGIAGNAAYSYSYVLSPNDGKRLYFRIKVLDAQGDATYSPLRIIDLDAAGGAGNFLIYPNPPNDFINVVFPFADSEWQVDILAADGSRVQRNYYKNTASGRVNFIHRLPSGTYFVRATDLQSAKSRSASFIIR